MKLTSCQRWGSGSLDHTGIPRRTTPLLKSQNSVPGVACCTSGASRLGPFLAAVRHVAVALGAVLSEEFGPGRDGIGSPARGLGRAIAF